VGIDLTVCPIIGNGTSWWLGYNRLKFNNDNDLYDLVKQLPVLPLPHEVDFDWYEDDGVKKQVIDSKGNSLTFTHAGHFRKIDLSYYKGWNFAVLTFLQALPPTTPVVLWWH
jgi:hypothetical protein